MAEKKLSKEAKTVLTKGSATPPKPVRLAASRPEPPPMKPAAKKHDVGHEVVIKGYIEQKKKMPKDSVEKSLRASTMEGAFNSASHTIATSYTTPYALSLGATNSEIGLLNASFHLAATMAQIPGAMLTRYLSRKGIWVGSTLASRLSLLPLVLLPFFGLHSVAALIVLYGVYSFFNSLRTPAWTSLIGDIVPDDIRGRYFGRRNMVMGLAGLLTMLASGWLLTHSGFPVLFVLAALVGLSAIFFFVRIVEVPFRTTYHYRHELPSFGDMVNTLRLNRNLVFFTLFLSVLNFAVNIAAPFFAVYMLADLKLGYLWYAIIVSTSALITLLAQPHWGKVTDRFGERKVIVITGVLVCFVPLLYLFIRSPFEVLAIEMFSAFAWAGFELAAFNFVLAVTPAEKRPTYVANHTFFKGLAIVLGTLAGAVLVAHVHTIHIGWLAGLQVVFFISFALRAASLLFLVKLDEVRPREDAVVPIRYVLLHAIGVEPAKGLAQSISYTFRYPYELRKLKEQMIRDAEQFGESVRRKVRS